MCFPIRLPLAANGSGEIMTNRLKSNFNEDKIDRADDGKFGHGPGKPKKSPAKGRSPSKKPKRTPAQLAKSKAKREAAREKLANDTARKAEAILEPISQQLADSGLDNPVRTLQTLAVKLSFVGGVEGAKEAISEAVSDLKAQSKDHKRALKDAVRESVQGLPKKAQREIAEAIQIELTEAGIGDHFTQIARALSDARKESAQKGNRSGAVATVLDAMEEAANVREYHADVQEALIDRSDEDIDDMIHGGYGGFAPKTDDDGEPVEDIQPYRDAYRQAMRKTAEALIGEQNVESGAGKEREKTTEELRWRIANADKIRALPTHAHVKASEGVLQNARLEEQNIRGTHLNPAAKMRVQRLEEYHGRMRAQHEAAIAALKGSEGGIR